MPFRVLRLFWFNMEIHTIGGFNEVGKNMTVVHTGDDAIMFDAGVYLPAVIELQEQEAQESACGASGLSQAAQWADHGSGTDRASLNGDT